MYGCVVSNGGRRMLAGDKSGCMDAWLSIRAAYYLRPLKSVLPTLLEGQTILKFDRVCAKIYQRL